MAKHVHWPRILRRTLRVFAGFIGLVLLAWAGLAWYINTHKAEILQKVNATLSEQMRGDLHISGLEPSLFNSFPNISLALKDVTLRDSLWATHHHSLLEAKDIFVRINPFALISHRVEVRKITVSHAAIFLYTDSSGYSNSYLLSKKDTTKKNRTSLVDRFGIEDTHLWFVSKQKQKLFHIYLKELDGTTTQMAGEMDYHIAAKAHAYEFNFSTIRGSYIHDQDLSFDLQLKYHKSNKRLEIPDQQIRIGETPLSMAGNFYFNQTPAAFNLHLHTESIIYRTAVSWMSPNIRKIADSFDFRKPIAIDVKVSGIMQYHSIPLVKAVYRVRDNTLVTPVADIDNISYDGEYYNEATPGAGHGDDNSRMAAYSLKGSFQKIPFQSDTLAVTNLLKPIVNAHIRSAFAVSNMNDIVGSDLMSFDKGRAEADLRYTGGIGPDDPTPYAINGYVRIAGAGLTYLPRNLAVTDVGATLLFEGDNLFFRNIALRSRQSSVTMEGDALHFLRFYFSDPGKVSIAWRLRGPLINLNDFLGFATKRRAVAAPHSTAKSRGIARIRNQLDEVLEASSISLDARLDKMVYQRFIAESVVARLTVAESGIVLQEVALTSGGGSLNISGAINQTAANNPFNVKAQVRNTDVARLFSSFSNFGQSAITADNLAGRITADADVSGNITDAGAILQNSFNGAVTFKLEDGQINHFSPFEQVGKFVFKKRNLSAVAVKDLQGRLDIAGPKIFIRPMNIQTSVLNMNVQGVYGLGGGTDIYLEIPLRNPEKEGAATPIGMLLRTGKGFVVHLRAQDPSGAGVKIGWDPMRKGRKATEAILGKP